MSQKLEYFPFYVEAFHQAVRSWRADAVGAYWLLLIYQWLEGSVPGDSIDDLAVIMHEPVSNAKKLWATKIAAKFPKGPNGYQNRRLETERQNVLDRIAVSSRKGSKGAAARWSNGKRDAPAIAQASLGQSFEDSSGDGRGNADLESRNLVPTPLPPPSAEGGGTLAEARPMTREERSWAKAIVDRQGCPHGDTCEDAYACMGRMVGERRAQERKGIQVGVA